MSLRRFWLFSLLRDESGGWMLYLCARWYVGNVGDGLIAGDIG